MSQAPPEPSGGHLPVLSKQVLEGLAPRRGATVVDATLGQGGHALEIARRIGPEGTLIGLDLDAAQLNAARERLASLGARSPALHLIHASFAELPERLDTLDISRVDALLADLGFASTQMDDPKRGLSFQHDGPLDMRLNPEAPTTAEHLIRTLPRDDLADLIYTLGEERLSRRIAQKIDENRRVRPIRTTGELARLVRAAYPVALRRRSRIDPATRTFMALRIAVNGELDALDALLEATPARMNRPGRVAVISFHSLEDRRVKQAFVAMEQAGHGRRINRKVVTADDSELQKNPRSRSAKLRVFEFTDES